MPASATFLALAYAQAPPTQRGQALGSAQQVLGAAYPHLSRPQWEAALACVQPLLLLRAGQALLAHEGLVTLGQQLTAYPPAAGADPLPASSGTAPPTPLPDESWPAAPSIKQTYALPLTLREGLARVSYWRRIPVSRLVVSALTRLVASYPDEAARPLPPPPQLV